jgi:hypothetical protein
MGPRMSNRFREKGMEGNFSGMLDKLSVHQSSPNVIARQSGSTLSKNEVSIGLDFPIELRPKQSPQGGWKYPRQTSLRGSQVVPFQKIM